MQRKLHFGKTQKFMAFFFLLFKQFPFLIAIRILWIESTRRIFDRYAVLGYAAGGEDRLVASIFPTPGFCRLGSQKIEVQHLDNKSRIAGWEIINI